MQHGFGSSYNLFNSHRGVEPLRDPSGVTEGWKPFFDRASGDLQCSSSSTSPKAPMASHASAEFCQPGGAFSEMAAVQAESLMVAPEPEVWQAGRLVLDDTSLRCLLPGGQPKQGLSMSMCNPRPSDVSLPEQQQSFNQMEGMRRQNLSNWRSLLVARATTDAHVQAQHHQQQQNPLLQEGQFFPQRVMASPSSPGLCSQPPLHLTSSKYLVPIQELLNEFCGLGAGSTSAGPKKKPHSQWEEGASSSSTQWNQSLLCLDILELKKRLANLVSLLEEVDRRYRRYCEQMRVVVSSFEPVAGEGAALVYSTLASKAMSRHFRCLRDGIVGQIKATQKTLGEKDPVAPGSTRGDTPRLRLLDHYIRQQKAFQQADMMETHPWRPQRGLPERSVSVLRAWLFEHFLHPYPSDVDKHILARQTGLSRSQVCNWFINARVRLWKPMVEEMYLEETREQDNQSAHGNAGPEDGRQHGHAQNPKPSEIHHLLLSDDQKPRPPAHIGGGSDADDSLSSVVNSSHNSERSGVFVGGKKPRYPPPGRYHQQLQQLTRTDNNNFGVVDMDFPPYNECGGGQQNFSSGAVSLTLGLQQHNGEGISLSFPPGSQSTIFFSKEPMDGYQPVQFSILDGDARNPPYRNLMRPQRLLHDLSG